MAVTMTREHLYKAYIEELKFFNPLLRNRTEASILADYDTVSKFKDVIWIDLFNGPETVGFILIATGEHCTIDADYLIMETYVHPKYRSKGVCYKMINRIFKKNPGKYGMFILNSNIEAHKFWNKVRNGYPKKIETLQSDEQLNNAICRYYLWNVE